MPLINVFVFCTRSLYKLTQCPEVRGHCRSSELFRVVQCSLLKLGLCTVVSTLNLDEQFLQFSGLGFVSLGPFHCAYIYWWLCLYFFIQRHYCNTVGEPGGTEA